MKSQINLKLKARSEFPNVCGEYKNHSNPYIQGTTVPCDIYIQVNKKFCELKGGNIGIVEKAQGTRFGMSPKYSRYIGIE